MPCGHADPAVIELMATKIRDIGLTLLSLRSHLTGFVYNRICAAIKREVMMVLAEDFGTPQDIDKLFRNAFHLKVHLVHSLAHSR
jgi:3-hydroxyacyl-CoA dehydrogenase